MFSSTEKSPNPNCEWCFGTGCSCGGIGLSCWGCCSCRIDAPNKENKVIKALIFPVNDRPFVAQVASQQDAQSLIKSTLNGGYMEHLTLSLDENRLHAYMDGDGKMKNLTTNLLADRFIKAYLHDAGLAMNPGDRVVGNVIVFASDDEGNEASCPESAISYAMKMRL